MAGGFGHSGPPQQPIITEAAIEDAKKLLRDVEGLLSKYQPLLQQSGARRFMKALVWPGVATEAKEILDKLQEVRNNFMTAVTVRIRRIVRLY